MIQFREVFLLSPRLGIRCSVSGRFQQTPLASAHCSALPVLPVLPVVVSRHAWLGRCTLLVRCNACVHTLSCHLFYAAQHDYAACHERYLAAHVYGRIGTNRLTALRTPRITG